MNAAEKFAPIRKGLLEFAVLKVISAHKVYAADIIKQLAATELQTQEGTLYPLLSRLRRENAVSYEWVESEAGPPRKYYQLTNVGQERLVELNNYWLELNKMLHNMGAK